MRNLRKWFQQALITLSLLLVAPITLAAGLLSPADNSLPPLQIRTHDVRVLIEDGYAMTEVEQTFHNPHSRDLEAIYSFPVPEQGAVAEFTVWIDGQPVVGEVLEKERAREVYRQEKAAGREAGLAEKDGYRTFDIRVSPVRAGQETRIRLVYYQPARVDTGIGRYLYPLEEGGVDERKLAFWTANETVSERFTFDLLIRSAYPIEAMRMPNQAGVNATRIGPGEWRIQLANQPSAMASAQDGADAEEGSVPQSQALTGTASPNTPVFTLDQDLLVYWRHQAGLPGSVDLVAHKRDPAGRGTFMMVVTPGDDLQPISEGRDWVFVLDISGSMSGKYATLADGVQRALGKLNPQDRFRIILFNRNARELTPGYVNASAEAVNRYSREVAAVQPGENTNLYAGLKMGIDGLDSDRSGGILLVTDGVANVGETEQRRFLSLLERTDVRLFTFVMGNSANRPLLDAMTNASGGFAIQVSNADDIVGQILTAVSKLTHQALHGVELSIEGVKTADITPARIGSLYRGQQLVMMGHYWGDGEAQVELRGKISGEAKRYQTRFHFPAQAEENPELERLWAYASIQGLQAEIDRFGEKADLKQAATDLALEYGLVTNHTSMIVVREEQFAAHGIERNNQQRVARERAAQQQRAGAPIQSNRVDTAQPMYSAPRASHGGGGSGAVSPWLVLLLLALVPFYRRSEGER